MSEEDKKMLIEMKLNCLEDRGTSRVTYNDEKRLKKAKAIDNALNEIERLNNIINELEKYINETKLKEFEKEYGRRYGKTFTQAEVIICNMILNKLQELKGSDK